MAKKRYSAEQIIQLFREVEIHTSEGKTITQTAHQIGVTEQLREELLNGKIFTSLKEAQILTERWRREYNDFRPHSDLNYQSPTTQSA